MFCRKLIVTTDNFRPIGKHTVYLPYNELYGTIKCLILNKVTYSLTQEIIDKIFNLYEEKHVRDCFEKEETIVFEEEKLFGKIELEHYIVLDWKEEMPVVINRCIKSGSWGEFIKCFVAKSGVILN